MVNPLSHWRQFSGERFLKTAWQEKNTISDNRYIELHYEDFVRNPYKTLRVLLVRLVCLTATWFGAILIRLEKSGI